MEDILASIRRILSEDEPAPADGSVQPPPAEPPQPSAREVGNRPPAHDAASELNHHDVDHREVEKGAGDHVLLLDSSMMIEEPNHNALAENVMAQKAETGPASAAPPSAMPSHPAPQADQSLVAPEAAAAAASSVGSLVRALTERSAHVYQGGPTIEDLVRDEIRPVLKQWLDANLPPLVERLVRVEIERVVSRATT